MRTHVVLWLSICAVLLLLAPMLMPIDMAQGRMQTERSAAEGIFGREATLKIARRAHSMHDLLVVQSGLQGLINTGYTTEDALKKQDIARDGQRTMGSVVNKYLYTLSSQLYGYFFRFHVMVHWAFYLAVFLAAVVVDGAARRRVKTDTAALISSTAYAFSQHAMVLAVFLPIVYLLAPFHVTPWFMPGWAVAVAFPVSTWLAHAGWLE